MLTAPCVYEAPPAPPAPAGAAAPAVDASATKRERAFLNIHFDVAAKVTKFRLFVSAPGGGGLAEVTPRQGGLVRPVLMMEGGSVAAVFDSDSPTAAGLREAGPGR